MLRRRLAGVASLLILTSCGTPAVSAVHSPVGSLPSATIAATAAPRPSTTPQSPVSATPTPAPITVTCKTGVAAASLLLIGHHPAAGSFLYEVSDPIHPRLICHITGTTAHVVNSTSIAYLRPVSPTET